jgi:hypothetical protein
MSSFYPSQGNRNGNGYNSREYDRQQGLPSYNNNYEHRFQTSQYGSNQRSNGMSVVPSYAHGLHYPSGVNVFEVRFKCNKGDYLLPDSLSVKPGDFVKVEADRGYDIGVIFKKKVMNMGMEIPRKRILGHVNQEEMSILPHKMLEETQAVAICRQMAAQHRLPLIIADVEFQFDRNKLTVIFASEGRIDFRELVRDMFSFFHIRIWMQKVSPSEAVAMMDLAAADEEAAGGGGSGSGSSVGSGGSVDSDSAHGGSVSAGQPEASSPPQLHLLAPATGPPVDLGQHPQQQGGKHGRTLDSHSSDFVYKGSHDGSGSRRANGIGHDCQKHSQHGVYEDNYSTHQCLLANNQHSSPSPSFSPPLHDNRGYASTASTAYFD